MLKKGEIEYAEFIKIIPIDSKENSFTHCYWNEYYGIGWDCNSVFYFNLIEVGTSKNVLDLILISIVGILGYGFCSFWSVYLG